MSRGIRELMWVSLLCALIEAGGLVLLILVGMSYWSSIDYLDTPAVAGGEPADLLVMQCAVFAFFAFIGFEDMMYLTEETREPERTLPLGLIRVAIAPMRRTDRRGDAPPDDFAVVFALSRWSPSTLSTEPPRALHGLRVRYSGTARHGHGERRISPRRAFLMPVLGASGLRRPCSSCLVCSWW